MLEAAVFTEPLVLFLVVKRQTKVVETVALLDGRSETQSGLERPSTRDKVDIDDR